MSTDWRKNISTKEHASIKMGLLPIPQCTTTCGGDVSRNILVLRAVGRRKNDVAFSSRQSLSNQDGQNNSCGCITGSNSLNNTFLGQCRPIRKMQGMANFERIPEKEILGLQYWLKILACIAMKPTLFRNVWDIVRTFNLLYESNDIALVKNKHHYSCTLCQGFKTSLVDYFHSRVTAFGHFNPSEPA